MGDVYKVLRNHFELTAAEMTLAYQKSYGSALSAIAAGLSSKNQWQSFWQKITDSQVKREFAGQIVAKYLQPFAKEQRWDEAELALKTCQALTNQYETLFKIAPFELTDDELAALVNETEIASLSNRCVWI